MRTSYSALDTYTQCPQKYKFQEIDRIPSKKHKEAIFGTLIHSALKFMFEKSPLYPTLDQVLEYYREHWAASGADTRPACGAGASWQDETAEKAYFDEGARILKNFYAKNAPWNFSVVDLESHFEVSIPDRATGETHVLAGKIDRIDKLGDGTYEVIDYKTARKLPSQEKVDRDFQLSIYSLGFQKKWPHIRPDQIKLSLYFLKHGEKLSTSRDEKATAELQERIRATIGEIRQKVRAGERFEPVPSPLCDWCSYKPLCPAWRHLYKTAEGRGAHSTQDEMKTVIAEYFDLAKNKEGTEERMAELKQKIREYMEREELDRVFGENGYVSRSVQKRFSYDFEKVKGILEPLGKWQDVLDADEQKLKLVLKEVPEDIRAKIEAARILTKEFTVLTASAKKIKKPDGFSPV